ncbi:MAG TPA: HAMP domain-containing protein, partial [Terriglobia bacterium]|nr:HAMP domain-containing protein [Terriglobia bacterium]
MSIRGKLTAIVAGAVAALTTAVLISVWLSSWQEVRKDVHNELEAARHDFVVTEGEHLHEHVLEATTIAESEELQPLLARNDSKGACAWLSGILAGKGSPVNPEDDFDLLAVVLPNGEPLGVVVRGEEPCVRRPVKHPFPALQSKQRVPEITNWESGDDKLYEVIAAPVVDAQGRDAATLMMGFEVTDSMARHIKEHTGQDNIVWHKEGNEFHVLGVSNPGLRSLLTAAVEKSNGDTGEDGGSYAILDTHIEDHADPVFNPKGLHIGLVQSLDDKFEPFRRLEYLLALMAVLALVLGWLLGLFLARPIAMPLVHLAKAADSVAHDQLDSADSLLLHYPDRLINAKDEIGVLGRSFREMVHGLKERLAMVPFVSEAT